VERDERLGDGEAVDAEAWMSPSYKCPYYSRWAGVYLNTIRWHGGTRYYARMAVKFWYEGRWRWDVGWFRNGFWTFPLVFPYL
jgi:hypothetical protein